MSKSIHHKFFYLFLHLRYKGVYMTGIGYKVWRLSVFRTDNKRRAIYKITQSKTEEKMLFDYALHNKVNLDKMMYISTISEYYAFRKGMQEAFRRIQGRNVNVMMRHVNYLGKSDFHDLGDLDE